MIKFGTGGFRGVIGDDFNKHNVTLVARGISEIIKSKGEKRVVAVGYDHRFGSELFACWMAEEFSANGIKCLLYTEPMPTPAVMTAVRDEGLDYGVMLTASHNPFYFNGVKVIVKGGADAGIEFTDELERTVLGLKEDGFSPANEELIVPYTNKQRYSDNIRAFLSPEVDMSGLKVLYDNIHGVGARCILPIAESLGIKLKALRTERDAFFGFCPPNPTEAVMEPLRAAVRRGGYTFAMATDSDSDRLGILDEKGNYVSNNDIFACIYYYLVKYRGMAGDAVRSCATSVLLDGLAAALGYECHEVDVGFKNISAEMKRVDALIGGESSGGLTVRGYIYGKDSVFSSMLFAEAVAAIGLPVSELVKKVHGFAGYTRTFLERELTLPPGFAMPADGAPEFCERVISSSAFGANVKYELEGGSWALLRKSGTEPVLRVFAECADSRLAKKDMAAVEAFVARCSR